MKKKLLAVLMTLAMMLSLMPTAMADEPINVAQVNGQGYTTLAAAVDAAESANANLDQYGDLPDAATVVLLKDLTISEMIKIESPIKVDLGGNTLSCTAKKAFEVYKDAIFVGGTKGSEGTVGAIINTNASGRCIDTRKNVTLKVEGITLQTTGASNPQPLTIGGSDNGTKVNLLDVTIDAGKAGYGIISFVKSDLSIQKSSVTGYSALYMKEGTAGSEVKVNGSALISKNENPRDESNSFATIVLDDDDITLSVFNGLANSSVVAEDKNGSGQVLLALGTEATGSITGAEVWLFDGVVLTATGDAAGYMSVVALNDNFVSIPSAYVDKFEAEGYVVENNKITGVSTSVSSADELKAAIENAQPGATIKLADDVTVTLTEGQNYCLLIDKGITIDGNNKKITFNGAYNSRVFNIDTTGAVNIKDLTVETNGERAFNVINKASTLTLESVTATAANYVVMVATSATGAKLNVNDSVLTGLNVINVAAPNAVVTVDSTKLTCNDQSVSEGYAALMLTQTANAATITATGVTFDIKGDSYEAYNGADNGKITIGGDEADITGVAFIEYEGGYTYGFTTLEDALTYADTKSSVKTVKLARNIELSESITIPADVTLDLSGKTISAAAGYVLNVDGKVYTVSKAVTGVTLNKSTLSLNVGGNETLTATVAPDNATDKSVTWTSSNDAVATVDSNGKVSAVSAGTATITVTTTDGSFTATCGVTVSTPSSGSSSGGSSSSSTTTTEKNPDGSTTTTTTNKTTGAVTETTKNPDGTTGVTKTDADGNVTEVSANVPAAAAKAADKADEPVTLPIEVEASDSSAEATEIKVNVPSTGATVEIPVENVTPGTVVVIVNADGTESIVPITTLTEDGVVVTLEDDATIKVIDNSKDFTDVADDYALADSIDFVSARGLFEGNTETTFNPHADTTIAQTMTVLARLSGEDFYGAGATAKGAEWATEKGLSDGTDVNKAITREQMVVMMWKLAGMPESDQVLTASDVNDISADALTAMQWAVEMGILKGNLDGTINPNGNASRAHVAAFTERYVNALAN